MSSRSMRLRLALLAMRDTLAPSVAICDTGPVGRFEFPCAKGLGRWVRRSTKARANSKQSSPVEKIISPEGCNGLHRLAQIRTSATSQRDEYSLCTSKFESDMPNRSRGCAESQTCPLVGRRVIAALET